MRFITIILFLLLASGTGLATDKPPTKKPGKDKTTAETQQEQVEKTIQKKKSVQWPRPYKSTEEISADSTVPFPTDI